MTDHNNENARASPANPQKKLRVSERLRASFRDIKFTHAGERIEFGDVTIKDVEKLPEAPLPSGGSDQKKKLPPKREISTMLIIQVLTLVVSIIALFVAMLAL